VMTPFEYTENPWFGWGLWDDNWGKDPTDSGSGFTNATFLPLDGDLATNENDAWVIDWAVDLPPNGGTKTLKQLLVDQNSPVSATNPPIITHPLDQTRGEV